MDMMEIRRRVLVKAMAGGGQIKTGTFSGNGSKTVTIPCSFIPDIITVSIIADDTMPLTFVGIRFDTFVKGDFAVTAYEVNTANHNLNAYLNTNVNDLIDFNATTYGTRQPYATADGSSVTIDHNTGSNTFGYYASGYTYEYALIKLS